MSRVQTLQSMFKRYRRPGDIVFAWFVLIASLLLLSQLFDQTAYKTGAKLFAQPRFWPGVSLLGMAGFALAHLIGSALSDRIEGRWQEVFLWLRGLEYALWFVAYAALVPVTGYLLTTVGFAVILSFRVGYRRPLVLALSALCAIAIVVLFKTLLRVNLPAGRIYDAFPDGLRQIMLTYF